MLEGVFSLFSRDIGIDLGDVPIGVGRALAAGHADPRTLVHTADSVFDPSVITLDSVLRLFWENHDPTQGMRQGNDRGTQYRSAIYWANDAQRKAAEASREMYQAELAREGYGEITTEIAAAGPFYYAEPYHQQYLAKNPNGYCGLGGTGVACPVGLAPASS